MHSVTGRGERGWTGIPRVTKGSPTRFVFILAAQWDYIAADSLESGMQTTIDGLTERYREMSSDDLLRLWADYSSLTEDAVAALGRELQTRELIDPREAERVFGDHKSAVELATRRRNSFIDRGERVAIAACISWGCMILCALVLGAIGTVGVALSLGDCLRYGFWLGLAAGFVPRTVSRTKLAIIAIGANVVVITLMLVGMIVLAH